MDTEKRKNTLLDDQRENNPFITPPRYFESFDLELQQRIASKSTTVSFKMIFKWVACFIGFGIGIQLFLHLVPEKLLSPTTQQEERSYTSQDSYDSYYIDQGDLIYYLAENKDIPLE